MQIEIDCRIVGAKAGQRRQKAAGDGVAGGDPNAGREVAGAESRIAQGILKRIENMPGVPVKAVTLGGQRDAVRMAFEQLYTESALQQQDCVGDRRLRHGQLGRRHRELTGFSGGGEVAHLPERDFLCHLFFEYLKSVFVNLR